LRIHERQQNRDDDKRNPARLDRKVEAFALVTGQRLFGKTVRRIGGAAMIRNNTGLVP